MEPVSPADPRTNSLSEKATVAERRGRKARSPHIADRPAAEVRSNEVALRRSTINPYNFVDRVFRTDAREHKL